MVVEAKLYPKGGFRLYGRDRRLNRWVPLGKGLWPGGCGKVWPTMRHVRQALAYNPDRWPEEDIMVVELKFYSCQPLALVRR